MSETSISILLEPALLNRARELGIDVLAAAVEGVRSAVSAALAAQDRSAYLAQPEAEDGWGELEAWS